MIVCAGDIEQFSFAQPIGVGLQSSAINLTRLVMISSPEFLLFVGTAGSYGRLDLLKIVESKSACNVEHSLLFGNSYTPIDNMISVYEGDVSHETIVNSSNYITTSKEVSKRYLEHNIDIENMEFFSVMAVAKEFNIPVGGIFCITNYCNSEAHKEFMNNRLEAMNILEKYIKQRVGKS